MDLDLVKITKYPLFSEISGEEISHMLACIGGYKKNHKKGEYVIFDGDNVKCVGLLLTGSVKMIKEDAFGEKSILTTISESDIFGESFVFGGTGSTVSFVAERDIEVLYLPFSRVLHTCGRSCNHHKRLIDNMVELIAKKNIQLTEKLEITSKKSLRAKILTYLSQQSQKTQKRQFVVPHGRLEMADYLCTDRSALTRELTKMKEEGIIDYDKNTFRIM